MSALMTAKLATHLLAPCGMLIFTGSKEVFHEDANDKFPYALSKSEVMQYACEMGELKNFPENCIVSVILPSIIDTKKNRQAMPMENHKEWEDPNLIAEHIKQWALGEDRPGNGAFAEFTKHKKKLLPLFT